MALTNAEKVKRYRERQKQATLARATTDPKIFRSAFCESAASAEWDFGRTMLEMVGISAAPIHDDSDPEFMSMVVAGIRDSEPNLESYKRSLGRAELTLDHILEATTRMAKAISNFKRDEIDARISEIQQSDLSDSAVKKQAFADMAKLQKMRDQLDKQVRSTFPQWKVTGE